MSDSKDPLQYFLGLGSDEEEDGNFDFDAEESEDESEEKEVSEKNSSDNEEETEETALEQIHYDFDVRVDPKTENEEGIFTSEPFKTNQHQFYLGFYRKTTGILPFIFSHDIKRLTCVEIHLTVGTEEYVIEDEVMTEEHPMERTSAPLHTDITEEMTIHVSLDYVPNANESKKYFGCVGLHNDGMTCYLNSLIQSLFHIRGFRKLVFNMDTDKSEIPMALANLFGKMQTSRKPVSTRHLTRSFGWETEDLFEQQDVQELMRILLDRLDNCSDNEASKLFKGVFNSYIRVPTKNYESAHQEPFYDMSLLIKGIDNIQESIKQYFEPDKMTGNDQYEMEDKTKVDAIKGLELVSSPKILCLHLRRFEYANGEMDKITSEFKFTRDLTFGDSEYRLCSIIAHVGYVYGGHYCAFVHRDGRWLCFNDDEVSEVTEEEAIEGNFGGKDHSLTAYVLFYTKVDALDELIDCADPEISEKVRADILTHKVNREVRYITSEEFGVENQYKKAQIPRDGSLEDVKAAFEATTSLKDIVLRSIDKNGSVGEIITEEDVQTTNKFYVSETTDIPIAAELYIPGYKFYSLPTITVADGSDFTNLSETLCKACDIEDIGLTMYTVDQYDSVVEVIENKEITKSVRILFQIPYVLPGEKKELSSDPHDQDKTVLDEDAYKEVVGKLVEKFEIEEYTAPEDTPLSIIGDELDASHADTFYELTTNFYDIAFKKINADDEPTKMVLPLSLTFDEVISCVAKKLGVDKNTIIIFRPGSIRKFEKLTHNFFYQMVENEEKELEYDIAPGPLSVYERSDVTVVDAEGKVLDRFGFFLPRGKQSLDDLKSLISEKVKEPFHIYFSHSGIPKEPQMEDRVEFNSRCIVQIGVKENLDEDEVLLKVIYANSGYFVTSMSHYEAQDEDGVPYFIVANKNTFVTDILKEVEEKSTHETNVVKGTSRNLSIVDSKDLKAGDLSDMFISVIIQRTFEDLFGSASTPLHMNK